MPPPSDTDAQFRFLIACIKHSTAGRVDFREVAAECGIVSKGAAAKRYERLMKSHGPAAANSNNNNNNNNNNNATTANNTSTADMTNSNNRPGTAPMPSFDRNSGNSTPTAAIRKPPASNKKRKLAARGNDLDEHEVKVEVKSEVKQEQLKEVKEEAVAVPSVTAPAEYMVEAGQQWLLPHLHEHHQHHPMQLQHQIPLHSHHQYPNMATGLFYQDGIWLETQAMIVEEGTGTPFFHKKMAPVASSSSSPESLTGMHSSSPESLAGMHWQQKTGSPPSEVSTGAQGHWTPMDIVQSHPGWCIGNGSQQSPSLPDSQERSQPSA